MGGVGGGVGNGGDRGVFGGVDVVEVEKNQKWVLVEKDSLVNLFSVVD